MWVRMWWHPAVWSSESHRRMHWDSRKDSPREKNLRRKIWTGSFVPDRKLNKANTLRELTYLVLKALLKMISLFPQVGYVSSLEVSQPQPLQKEIYPGLVRELKFGTVPMVSSEKASHESLLIHKRKIQRFQEFTPKSHRFSPTNSTPPSTK